MTGQPHAVRAGSTPGWCRDQPAHLLVKQPSLVLMSLKESSLLQLLFTDELQKSADEFVRNWNAHEIRGKRRNDRTPDVRGPDP